jgi:hypothetical protein
MELWEKCVVVMAEEDFEHKKCQKEIVRTLETLCNLYSLNQSPATLKLIEKLNQKLPMPPPKLQAYLKFLLST